MSKRHRRRSTSLLKMDPDCAICRLPADADCGCEAKGLETAIKQAEQRIMHAMYMEIRTWVRQHAQDYVLAYFSQLSERRKAQHQQQIENLRSYAYHHYRAPPHPTDMQAADAQLKKGIDEDWQRSVQRYPEVLEYFFSLVEVTLPTENDPSVKDLPLGTLPIPRKVTRRSRSQAPATTIASGSAHDGGRDRIPRGRTPPALLEAARRTPGPPEQPRYHPRQIQPPPPGSAYNYPYN
ncbi:hypothetical protein MKZ38_005529 [Zalerion maritima]|uniref:Uncharacterized protein n=1 Tax=Zalerion maritima TaxID=339359 RepID=A0AAD5RXY5_9PEZI|nr:hypothetical protein MKZ38_005529 [Zalerion maritima]